MAAGPKGMDWGRLVASELRSVLLRAPPPSKFLWLLSQNKRD